MRGYFGLGQLSATEKSDILDQHKSLYNGYQTMEPKVSNTQPLYVYDDISDKDGFVVNNKGEVKKYTNMGINEQVETDESLVSVIPIDKPIGKIYSLKGNNQNYEVTEGSETCECGGEMYEGVCNECGSGYMEEETGHLDDIYNQEDLNPTAGFDYIQGSSNDVDTFEGMNKKLYEYVSDFQSYEPSGTQDGVDDPDNEDDGYEDINASEVTDGELEEIDIADLIKGKRYKYNHPEEPDEVEYSGRHKYSKGDDMYGFKGGKTGYSMQKNHIKDYLTDLDDEEFGSIEEQGGNADDMDVSNEWGAFDFESGGPGMGSSYPVNELEDDDIVEYEPMESAFADEEVEEGDIYGDAEFNEIDVSGVQGIYGDMERAYDFDSEGPGKAGPYQTFSYESELEEEEFEEVDEDLKESFLTQKNKITEMFNRFNKYN